MERRDFITKAFAAGSACAVAGPAAFASVAPNVETNKQVKCKITVVEKGYNKEMFQAVEKHDGAPCPVFELGQEFICDNFWDVPKGFCSWAWADIRPFIQQIWFGREVVAACCTDGKRPVSFKLVRFEE